MDKNKIMCEKDFARCFNVRIADKCCANCKHCECECEGEATCMHPNRNDTGLWAEEDATFPYQRFNVWQHNVCDLWEAKGEQANE
jgi:hypothetical protein